MSGERKDVGRLSLRQAHPAEYRVWVNLKYRCLNPRAKAYGNYGARGITVCPRWVQSFATFFADVGPRPSPKHSLDRHPNNDGNYEPGNWRWATARMQHRNKRTNSLLTFQGETLCFTEWAERAGVTPAALYQRIYTRKWSLDRALSEPRAPRLTAEQTAEIVRSNERSVVLAARFGINRSHVWLIKKNAANRRRRPRAPVTNELKAATS